MPAVRARRLCPEAIFVPPDFESYQAHSNRFREVLLSVTPLVEPISLDEAFLDVAGAILLFGTPPAIAERIRRDVVEYVGVTCSVGVAPNKLLAKLASEHAKPDGLVVVRTEEVHGFLDPLPARALWGVGEKTVEVLSRLGVKTIRDLAETPEVVLAK
jgi:DNA polymerase-4